MPRGCAFKNQKATLGPENREGMNEKEMKMYRYAKSSLAVLVLIATIAPLSAEQSVAAPHAVRTPRMIRPDVSYERSGKKLVFPIVGRAQGQNGTFFKSAVNISNFKGYFDTGLVPQRIKVEYYTAGVSGVGVPPTFYNLIFLGEHFEDFLEEFYTPAKSGLGSLVITAVDANGNEDPKGQLDGNTRIYTAQASSTGCPVPGGSVSQALSALPYEDLEGTKATAYIHGLRNDPKFRTNIGIVNHDIVPHTFNVRLLSFNGTPDKTFTITVQGKSLTHAAIPAGDYGDSLIAELYTDDAGDFYWSAYGSSTDNATGDGWINIATWN